MSQGVRCVFVWMGGWVVRDEPDSPDESSSEEEVGGSVRCRREIEG